MKKKKNPYIGHPDYDICSKCKYGALSGKKEPCNSCTEFTTGDPRGSWEPKFLPDSPTLDQILGLEEK